MRILPKTKSGAWSLYLLLGFVLLFLFTTTVIIGIFHQEGGDTPADNLYISIPMLSAFGLAIATFITGVFSIWKHRERSLLVYAAVAFGAFITLLLIGEITLPH